MPPLTVRVKEEVRKLLIAAIFFSVGFLLLILHNRLLTLGSGIEIAGFTRALVGGLIVAKVLLVVLALMSALTWAVGNLFFRSARGVSMFAVTAWANVIPPLPFALCALLVDGPTALLAPVMAPTWKGWLVLFYTVVPVMWLGYLIWGNLLRTYPAAKVGPISLLVPCVALGFAAWLVGEPVGGLRLVGIVVVLGGVATGLFASVRRMR